MSANFNSWRLALAGEKVALHADEPWCGYFKIRDRRGLNAEKAAIKRPFIACAIWIGAGGELKAERAKKPVPIEWLWPYCAKHPIDFETYKYWHAHERWPDTENVA